MKDSNPVSQTTELPATAGPCGSLFTTVDARCATPRPLTGAATLSSRHFCEACLCWHDGPWCPSPRVPEVRLSPGWLGRDIERARLAARVSAPCQRLAWDSRGVRGRIAT